MKNKSVAIIGAGLSGAVCAKALNGLVDKLDIFEKEAEVGGRLRLTDTVSTTATFNVTTLFFQNIIDHWQSLGWVSPHRTNMIEVLKSEINLSDQVSSDYQVLPNTAVLVENLLSNNTVYLETDVDDMERHGNQWRLFDVFGNYLGAYDCVLITSAAYPLHDLIKKSEVLYSKVKPIVYSVAWNVVLSFDEDPKLPYEQGSFIDSPISRFYGKFIEGRYVICIEATPEWSEQYSALPEAEIIHQLELIFCSHLDIELEDIVTADAKFWPFKSAINTLGEDCLFDDALGLGVCGDWCTSPQVEGAVLSGFSAADRVMKFFS
ncbi:MAG: NAD(P)-binding protein [Gammaproteobacteria bacterium]|nr:NAD(P)-binding protein [Gammaproteobacteria bacterium]